MKKENTVEKKSFVRLKAWLAILIMLFGYIYAAYSYLAASYDFSLMSPGQIISFFAALSAGFYLNTLKCERCHGRWNEAGNETYKDADLMLEFASKFLAESHLTISKNCRTCHVFPPYN